MGLFRKKDEETYTSSYDDSSAFSSSFGSSSQSNNDDDYEPDYEIDFSKELSNGSLVFRIIDFYKDSAGHVIVSSEGKITILESGFYEFDDDDRNYLRRQAQKFYDAR